MCEYNVSYVFNVCSLKLRRFAFALFAHVARTKQSKRAMMLANARLCGVL